MKNINNILKDLMSYDGELKAKRISGLSATATSFLCTLILKNIYKSLLYVVDDNVNTAYVKFELDFFLKFCEINEKIEVLELPDKYSEGRIRFFEKLVEQKTKKIVIANNSLLLETTISKEKLNKENFQIITGEIQNRNKFLDKLVEFGFSRQDEVCEKSDFSVRGEILDIWPINSEYPIRIIFNDEVIESIYEFNVTTQRREQKIEKFVFKNLIEDDSAIVMDYFEKNNYFLCYGSNYTNNTNHLFQGYDSVVIEPFPYNDIVDMKLHAAPNLRGVLNLFYKQLADFEKSKYEVYIVLYKEAEIKNLKDIILEKFSKINFLSGILREGFICTRTKTAILTEKDIFDRDYVADVFEIKKELENFDVFKDSMSDYKIGDFVVHSNYGIGKFLGFNKIRTQDRISEYITIEYLNSDKLYVPIYDFNLLHKYSNYDSEYQPVLDNLDGITWQKNKRRIEQRIFEMASEIIAIQARRKEVRGIYFEKHTVYEQEFAATFPYEETKDQQQAIKEVLDDMNSEMPMERLVCGDVGYGKTEVAIRAAFRSLVNSKQVILIAPTTILAKQHYNTFSKRFMNYPFKIIMLSRFCTQKELSDNKKLIQEGKADIIISTHSILRTNINFKNLGLVIIDEEHRFGVKDKEKLKRLQNNVDILFLSATPIPRTLSMALNGIKNISLIETPPPTRKEVSTHICEYDKKMIKDAINFELNRNGQVFYVYNNIEKINKKCDDLKNLIPNAKISIAHGQMSNTDLDDVMTKFFNKEIDILLCTTIVESGLDIPAVNMMIIDGAHRLGLAQIYQLRGRVGRGYEKAFCYIFFPSDIVLNKNAIKRLQAIQSFQGFGAGFKLAMRDLEIRGAGNILGKKQHGYIKEVGFELYMDMLNQAIAKNSISTREIATEIELDINAYIPDIYITSPAIRLYFYKRFLNLRDKKSIDDLRAELIDRYGNLPEVLENFCIVSDIRVLARKLGILSIREIRNRIIINFENTNNINIDKLLYLARDLKDNFKFAPDKLNTIEIYNFLDNKKDKMYLLKKILQGIE